MIVGCHDSFHVRRLCHVKIIKELTVIAVPYHEFPRINAIIYRFDL